MIFLLILTQFHPQNLTAGTFSSCDLLRLYHKITTFYFSIICYFNNSSFNMFGFQPNLR